MLPEAGEKASITQIGGEREGQPSKTHLSLVNEHLSAGLRAVLSVHVYMPPGDDQRGQIYNTITDSQVLRSGLLNSATWRCYASAKCYAG